MFRFLVPLFACFLYTSAGDVDVIQFLNDMSIDEGIACLEEHSKLLECVEPHKVLINHVASTYDPSIFYNIGFMRKGLQILQNVTECLGRDLECKHTKFLLFTLDTVDFAGEKVYGDAFHCFINANAIDFINSMPETGMLTEQEQRDVFTNPLIYRRFKSLFSDYVARKLYPTSSCTIGRVVDLYKAGSAALDWYYVSVHVQNGFPMDLEFDALKYC